MMWIIVFTMGFVLGYLWAFLKYNKRELDIILNDKDDGD